MKAAQPLAFISAGLLADHIFEPMMQEGQWLADLVGAYWGVGEGRGVALMISLFGFISLVIVFFLALIPSIRNADTALPDENVNNSNDLDVEPKSQLGQQA